MKNAIRPLAWLPFLFFVFFSACGTSKKVEDPNREFKSDEEKTAIGFHADLREYEYPFDTSVYVVQSQGKLLDMNYMDLRPAVEEKGVFLLLHGKNFNGAYFRSLAVVLYKKGYRVIIPDHIGFGKSEKPEGYQFSFHELARHHHRLLEHLGVSKVFVLGHSMGGMVATRFALMYPGTVRRLYLVNPIGLEDYRLSVPYRPVDELRADEEKMTPEKLRKYQQENYYAGKWLNAYEEWIQALIGVLNGPDFLRVATISALTTEMVYTQPIVYEFGNLRVPTTLLIGTRDRTAIGRSWTKPEVAGKLGNYKKLGRDTAKKIKGAKLVEMPSLGHVPFIENFPKFWEYFSKTL